MKKWWMVILTVLLLMPSLISLAAPPLVIENFYMVLRPKDGGELGVVNMVTYKNNGAAELKGSKDQAVIQVTLPQQAKGIQILDQQIATVVKDNSFYTTTPIPGNQNVVLPYTYQLSGVTPEKLIEIPVDQDVQAFSILIPEGKGSLQIQRADVIDQGIMEFQGQNYHGYTVSNVKAGENLKFNLLAGDAASTNKPTTGANPSTESQTTGSEQAGELQPTTPPFHHPGMIRMWYQSPFRSLNPHIFLGTIVLLILAGTYYYSRARFKQRLLEEKLQADEEEKLFQQLLAKQKTIMDKLIELETSYQSNQLPEKEFLSKKEAYKQHLIQVKLGLRQFVD